MDWGDGAGDLPARRRVLVTDQGRRIPVDLLYKCIGFRPCGDVAAKLVGNVGSEEGKTFRGAVPVATTMQVRSRIQAL